MIHNLKDVPASAWMEYKSQAMTVADIASDIKSDAHQLCLAIEENEKYKAVATAYDLICDATYLLADLGMTVAEAKEYLEREE